MARKEEEEARLHFASLPPSSSSSRAISRAHSHARIFFFNIHTQAARTLFLAHPPTTRENGSTSQAMQASRTNECSYGEASGANE